MIDRLWGRFRLDFLQNPVWITGGMKTTRIDVTCHAAELGDADEAPRRAACPAGFLEIASCGGGASPRGHFTVQTPPVRGLTFCRDRSLQGGPARQGPSKPRSENWGAPRTTRHPRTRLRSPTVRALEKPPNDTECS